MKITEKKFFVYILLTEHKTLYCGYTEDVEKRFNEHLNGKGAKYTKANKPVKILYTKEFTAKRDAMREECRIKKLTRTQKLKMIGLQEPLLEELTENSATASRASASCRTAG